MTLIGKLNIDENFIRELNDLPQINSVINAGDYSQGIRNLHEGIKAMRVLGKG